MNQHCTTGKHINGFRDKRELERSSSAHFVYQHFAFYRTSFKIKGAAVKCFVNEKKKHKNCEWVTKNQLKITISLNTSNSILLVNSNIIVRSKIRACSHLCVGRSHKLQCCETTNCSPWLYKRPY